MQQGRLHSARAELNHLDSELRALPAAMESSRNTLDDKSRAMDASRSATHKAEKDVEYRIGELSRGVKAFQALGLRFQTLPEGKLQLVFSRIDTLAPAREFSLSVRVDSGNRFQVLACDPPLTDLEPHVEELNASSDFSRFVQTIRSKFKELCA